MSEPIVLTSSGEPSRPTKHEQLVRLWQGFVKWIKSFREPAHLLSLLTLIVIGFQLYLLSHQNKIMQSQSTFMEGQSKIMAGQFVITEMQQKLATRPNVVLDTGNKGTEEFWVLKNLGPYKITNISMRQICFMKYLQTGWEFSASSTGLMETDNLDANQSANIPFKKWLAAQSKSLKPDETPIAGGDFVVMEIQFKREVDDRVYLLLQAVEFIGNIQWVVKPSQTSAAGPLKSACSPEGYSMELMYQFYRKNPLPYPVEVYNFHYLLGNDPQTTCLDSTKSLRF